MIGWDGAEGGGSNPQPSQSESLQGTDFQCDDGRQEDLPGPKFKSLRHLRQVKDYTTTSLKCNLLSVNVISNHTTFACQVLGASDFRQLAWHVLMGNQVIWRSADPGLIQSAFNVLKVS